MQPGSSNYAARLNQALAQFETRKPGISVEVPKSRQIKWSPEDTDSGVRPGATQDAVAASGPPSVPEIREPDLENDPALMEALWSVIINARGRGDSV